MLQNFENENRFKLFFYSFHRNVLHNNYSCSVLCIGNMSVEYMYINSTIKIRKHFSSQLVQNSTFVWNIMWRTTQKRKESFNRHCRGNTYLWRLWISSSICSHTKELFILCRTLSSFLSLFALKYDCYHKTKYSNT